MEQEVLKVLNLGQDISANHLNCILLQVKEDDVSLVGRPFPALRSAGRCVVLE